MKRLLATVGLLLAVASCVAPPTTVGSATPTPLATASPRPSPVVSAKGLIRLITPWVNAKLQSPLTITGDASVFEAALQWRISDTGGRVIAEGNTTASLGAPGRGTYLVSVPYTVGVETIAFVEVFSRSPKDGSIDDLVRVPVTLR